MRGINFNRIVFIFDLACVENTRMDRRSFHSLCHLLKIVGQLEPSKNMGVEEMVAIFLHILSHDVKNRVVKRQFMRSGETISRRFNYVLHAVLRCHKELLKEPEPIQENCTDERWKWFKVFFENFKQHAELILIFLNSSNYVFCTLLLNVELFRRTRWNLYQG